MLESLFTSKSRVKILKLLIFSQEDIHLREIARRTDVTPPYVKKEIEKLKKLNLVTETRRGNQKIFKINKSSPLYEDLKRMFLKTEVLGDVIKESLKNEDIKYALIFGSFAKGEENEKSDIDLLVIGSLKEESILKIVRDSESKTGREINYILWNEKEFEKRAKEGHHLLKDIIIKPVIMLIGDFDEFRRAVKK
jgi:predicted nucleotidyltransferase